MSASISGVVFTDANANGVIDGSPTDPGLSGVTVKLFDSSGVTLLQTTTTSASGAYTFSGLGAGTYKVQIIKPAADSFSPIGTSTSSPDSVVDPITGIATVTLTAPAPAGFNLGDAINYAIIAFDPASFQGTSDSPINGNVGVGGTSPKVQLAGDTINGNLTLTGAAPASTGGTVNGTVSGNSASLASDITNLTNLSSSLASETGTNIAIVGGGQIINATSGVLDTSGNYVFTVTSWKLGSGGITVVGDGSHNVVFNIGAGVKPKLDGPISLSGGLTSNQVLLNDRDTNNLQGAANGAVVHATILAPLATVNLDNVTIDGHLFGGASGSNFQFVSNAVLNSNTVAPTGGPVTSVSGIDAGVYLPASLTAHVYTDSNANGTQAAGEPNLAGVTVQLLNGAGQPTGTTALTDANGNVSFANLTPGTYEIGVITPAGDTVTQQTNVATPITLTSGGTANAIEGVYVPASLSGNVFLDQNANGVKEAGDTNLAGQTVTLLTGAGVSTGLTAITDSNGNYSFTNLTPGSYEVRVTPISGDVFSPQQAVTNSVDSIVNAAGTTAAVTVASGQTVPNQNAGEYAPASLTAHVYTDSNANGTQAAGEPNLAGVTVQLLNGAGQPTGTTALTDANGNVSFANLTPGTYEIGVITPAGDTVTQQTNVATPITLTSGGTANAIEGVYVPASLSGNVFLDQNANGVKEAADTNLAGQTVTLLTGAGVSTGLTAITDSNGNYSFTNLTPGSYEVKFIAPIGDAFSPQQAVTNSVDSIVNPATGITNPVTVSSGQTVPNQNAGVFQTAPGSQGNITGMVFLDGNCNGIYHVGDPGIAGVTVRLLDANGHPAGIVTTTDSYGHYSFNQLIPGQYEVQVVAPQGTDYSDEKNAGINPLLDSDVNPTTGITDVFVVAGGQTVAGVNAGLEFNGYFGGVSPTEIGHGTYLTNSGNNVIVGDGNNNVALGSGGNNIVVLDGHGWTSTVEIQGTGNDIVTSCGPLVAQTQTAGSGYIFAGNGGSSTLNGGLGNAYLMGAGSNDLIFGGAGHNVIIGGGSTGAVTTAGGVVTGYTDGDRLIAGGIDTVFLYEKGDGVVKIDGGLRSQDSLKISGYTAGQGQLIKVGGLDALWFGGNDLIVFYGQSPYVGGVSSQVSFTGLPGSPDTVVVFGADGKPAIVTSGGVAPAAPAPLVPPVPTPGGGNPTPVPGAPSSQTINLSGYNQVFDYTKVQTASNVDTTVKGSQGFATITVGDGNNTIVATGYGNVIKAGSGANTINAGETLQKVTVGDGSNTITATGYANVIVAGNGVNVIKAGAGGETVTVGNGANTITATGSGNVIVAGNGGDIINAGDNQNTVTVGNGTNTVIATGYNNLITVGDGHNTILAGAGGDIVDLGAGSDTVTLSGWSNLLIGGLGHASVSGGTSNVFRIEGVGMTGGLDVTDFGTTHNDVLDLSKVLASHGATPANIGGYVGVTGSGSDTVVSVDTTGGGHFAGNVVATLRGAGALSLADLQAQSAIKLS